MPCSEARARKRAEIIILPLFAVPKVGRYRDWRMLAMLAALRQEIQLRAVKINKPDSA
jgi:hypothetical protein